MLFKDRGKDLRAKLFKSIQNVCDEEKIKEAWTTDLICHTQKEGSMCTYDCSNYRGIALHPVAYKIVTNILLKRIYIRTTNIGDLNPKTNTRLEYLVKTFESYQGRVRL